MNLELGEWYNVMFACEKGYHLDKIHDSKQCGDVNNAVGRTMTFKKSTYFDVV